MAAYLEHVISERCFIAFVSLDIDTLVLRLVWFNHLVLSWLRTCDSVYRWDRVSHRLDGTTQGYV